MRFVDNVRQFVIATYVKKLLPICPGDLPILSVSARNIRPPPTITDSGQSKTVPIRLVTIEHR